MNRANAPIWFFLLACICNGCQKNQNIGTPHTSDSTSRASDSTCEWLGKPLGDSLLNTITIDPKDDQTWYFISALGLYIIRWRIKLDPNLNGKHVNRTRDLKYLRCECFIYQRIMVTWIYYITQICDLNPCPKRLLRRVCWDCVRNGPMQWDLQIDDMGKTWNYYYMACRNGLFLGY